VQSINSTNGTTLISNIAQIPMQNQVGSTIICPNQLRNGTNTLTSIATVANLNTLSPLPPPATHPNYNYFNQPQIQPNSVIPNPLLNNQIISPNHFINSQYSPIIYWYPTPPVSPSIYLHAQPPTALIHAINPCILIIKGAPIGVTISDILQFFNGYSDVRNILLLI
jgi:hypothetical protein